MAEVIRCHFQDEVAKKMVVPSWSLPFSPWSPVAITWGHIGHPWRCPYGEELWLAKSRLSVLKPILQPHLSLDMTVTS